MMEKKDKSLLDRFYDYSFFELCIALPNKLNNENTKDNKDAKEKRKKWVNIYVSICFVIPLLIFTLSSFVTWPSPLKYLIFWLFILRLFDLLPHLLDSLFHSEGVQYYERRVVLAIVNYAEIILWFAAFYMIFASHFNIAATYWLHALESSFRNMITFQWSVVKPSTAYGIATLLFQSAVGWLLTIGVLAIFISTLAQKDKK